MSSKVQEIVTQKILDVLEAGTIPWARSWNVDSQKNLNSKREYRGINRLLLEMYQISEGFEHNYWLTFGGCKKLEGNVKKGSKSNLVVFYKTLEKEDEETGEIKRIPLLRYYKVFNLSQCEGIEAPKEKEALDFEPIERADEVISGYENPPSYKEGGNRACYNSTKDHVQLPLKTKFHNVDAYYTTRFHELVHSTGHKSRLHRPEVMKIESWGDERYAKEELVAELGANFLGSHCGLDVSTIDRGANYIASWLKVLKDDKTLVISAAAKAQAAYDLILGENN